MTKTRAANDFLDVPRLVARHYEEGGRERHVTCLFRPAGHRLMPDEHFRIFPRPLPRLESLWSRKSRPVFGVTVVLRGEARLDGMGTPRRLVAGDVVVFAGERGDAFRYRDGRDFVEASVSLDSATARSLSALGLWPRQGPRRVDALAARVQYEALYHAIEVQSLSSAEVLRRTVAMLGWIQQPEQTAGADRGGEDFAVRACALLRDHHEPSARLAEIARQFGLSAAHFRRRFHGVVGLSPSAYRLRERMTRAAGLLGSCNVQETAFMLGYSDPFVFSRQFKARFGMSPRAFRASLQ